MLGFSQYYKTKVKTKTKNNKILNRGVMKKENKNWKANL